MSPAKNAERTEVKYNGHLVSVFKGDNYTSWIRRLKGVVSLASDPPNLHLAFEPRPNPAAPITAAEARRDKAALVYVDGAVDKVHKALIKDCATAREALQVLKEYVKQNGMATKAILQSELQQVRLGPNEPIAEYLTRVSDLSFQVLELTHEDPSGEIMTREITDIIGRVLQGLPEDKYGVTKQILRNMPNLTWSHVQRTLVQHEKSLMYQSQNESANFASTSSGSKKRKRFDGRCRKCNRKGHKEADCWEKHPEKAPKGWRSKFKKKSVSGNAKRKSPPEKLSKGKQKQRRRYDDSSDEEDSDLESFLMEEVVEESNYGSNKDDVVEFYIDSGCTSHMTEKEMDGMDSHPSRKRVNLATNGQSCDVQCEGDHMFETNVGEDLKLNNILVIPNLRRNLLSVRKLDEDGYEVRFKDSKCWIFYGTTLVATGSVEDNLYKVTLLATNESTYLMDDSTSPMELDEPSPERQVRPLPLSVWHERLGHIGTKALRDLHDQGVIRIHQRDLKSHKKSFCQACALGKISARPYNKSFKGIKSTRPLERIHSDVCGPMDVDSVHKHKYFVTFTDDFTRYSKVYPIRAKSDVFECFKLFKEEMEKIHTVKIGVFETSSLRTDGGGEYVGKEFQALLAANGIKWEPSTPDSPQQNPVSERMNRTLLDKARCMIIKAGIPKNLWCYAVETANYLRNRVITRSTGMSPYERLFGQKPNLNHIRTFGCNVYAKLLDKDRKKLDPKGMKCRFLGYDLSHPGTYIVMTLPKRSIKRSRDVIFDEDSFDNVSAIVHLRSGNDGEEQLEIPIINTDGYQDVTRGQGEQIFARNPDSPTGHWDKGENSNVSVHDSSVRAESSSARDNGVPITIERPSRNIKPPSRFIEEMNLVEEENLFDEEILMVDEPSTYNQAIASPQRDKWLEAIKSEKDSIVENDTYDVVDLPRGREAIDSRWVFKLKYGPKGEIARYKARLVAKGFKQVYGIDYTETFAPTAKLSSIRTILTIAARYNLELHQMDVVTAFLNGKIDEEVYVKPPKGMNIEDGKVLKLKKGLYGLKQSPRLWNETLDTFLKRKGFTQCKSDPCIYVRNEKGRYAILGVYVDDIIMAVQGKENLRKIKETLGKRFKMKDMGELKWVLGIEVKRDRKDKKIYLNQSLYVRKMLEAYFMEEITPRNTPAEEGYYLSKSMSPQTDRQERRMGDVPYANAIGKLLYLTRCTRPDIALAVGAVSRYMRNPGTAHWKAVKRIFAYLIKTADHCLMIDGNEEITLSGFADASLGSDIDDGKSVGGHVFFIGNSPVIWTSNKQTMVALSTMESEYIQVTEAAKEALYLRNLLMELGFQQQNASIIFEDNKACIDLSKNPIVNKRSKHIALRRHFIRDYVKQGELILHKVASKDNVADILTKGLGAQVFERHRDGLKVVQCPL